MYLFQVVVKRGESGDLYLNRQRALVIRGEWYSVHSRGGFIDESRRKDVLQFQNAVLRRIACQHGVAQISAAVAVGGLELALVEIESRIGRSRLREPVIDPYKTEVFVLNLTAGSCPGSNVGVCRGRLAERVGVQDALQLR